MRRAISIASLLLFQALLSSSVAHAEEGTPPPAVVKDWFNYLRGNWECDLGDGRTGKTTYKAVGKTFGVVFTARAKDFSILGSIGWRADKKKLVETDFHTEMTGVHGHLNREFGDITKNSIKGTGKFWDSSGASGSQALEYRRISDNEMTLSGSASDDGGQGWVVKFKRVKPKGK